MAIVGVICGPLVFMGLSAMTGPLFLFFLLNLIQILIVGGTTSVTIYSRLIAQEYVSARGMALAIATCTPPAVAAAAVPFLSATLTRTAGARDILRSQWAPQWQACWRWR